MTPTVFIYNVNVAVDRRNDAELDEALKELGIDIDDQDLSDFRERLEDIKQQHNMLDIKDIHKAYQECRLICRQQYIEFSVSQTGKPPGGPWVESKLHI